MIVVSGKSSEVITLLPETSLSFYFRMGQWGNGLQDKTSPQNWLPENLVYTKVMFDGQRSGVASCSGESFTDHASCWQNGSHIQSSTILHFTPILLPFRDFSMLHLYASAFGYFSSRIKSHMP